MRSWVLRHDGLRLPDAEDVILKSQAFKRPNAFESPEIFDYPAELPVKDVKESALDASVGAGYAKVRLDELQAGYAVARGKGNALGLRSGAQFELTDYPRGDFNKKYLLVATDLSLASNAHESGDDDIRISTSRSRRST